MNPILTVGSGLSKHCAVALENGQVLAVLADGIPCFTLYDSVEHWCQAFGFSVWEIRRKIRRAQTV